MIDRSELMQQIAEARKCIAFWRGVLTSLEMELEALPKEKPTGGKGKGRKKSIRDKFGHDAPTWMESDQIAWTVLLFGEAELMDELRTQRDRVEWIAERTGWAGGTVHVQLSIARQQGLIPDKRFKP